MWKIKIKETKTRAVIKENAKISKYQNMKIANDSSIKWGR